MSIEIEKALELVRDAGFKPEEMAAYWKVSVGGRSVYIAKTQKVSRIDISGFEFNHPAVKKYSDSDAKDLKMGKVRAQIDFSKSDDKVIEALQTALALLHHLAGQPVRGAMAKAVNKVNVHLVERAPRTPNGNGKRATSKA